MKFHSLILILLICCAAMVSTGCKTAAGYVGLAQDAVLPKLPPATRADYRDGLQMAIDNYDEKYDRDGNELIPEEPAEPADPEPTPEPEPEPTDPE